MTRMFSAIRAWVEQRRTKRDRTESKPKGIGWRPMPYADRVLIFDTETTIDAAQRLLFGYFRLYAKGRLIRHGLIVTDILDYESMKVISEYAVRNRLRIYGREEFVETVFYPEVYKLGTLCVGFNLPFDLTRIAINARPGNGEHRRKFSVVLSDRIRWHDLRIEMLSGSAAMIGFAPKRKLLDWEIPFFQGRFCDTSTLVRAFTGERKSLKKAANGFKAFTRKMDAPDLGIVSREALTYCRQDVRATYALFVALRNEYARHPFATFANEQRKSKESRYMGELYSSASIAKRYLRLLGIRPLLEKQPDFDRNYLGWFISAYFGGRSDVRVRKIDVPVMVLDFTSMYPTIFCLQRLDKLLSAPRIDLEDVTGEIAALVGQMASVPRSVSLFDPKFWRSLNCLVQLDPQGAILPIRMKASEKDPYTIAVTPIYTQEPRWYTLADVLAGMLLGGPAPKVLKAMRVVPTGRRSGKTVPFRGKIPFRSTEPIFKTIVEQRHIAKSGAATDPEYAALEMGLKQMAAGGSYGIYAEINVQPGKNAKEPTPGDVYSDIAFASKNVHDERPGAYANPIIATLVTGGARLMLALLESEVTQRGGTFAFCDTDSLAIVCGENCPNDIPSISKADVQAIVERFNALNPYNPAIIPNLLKVEYKDHPNLRCFAISAKRYALFDWKPGKRIDIVKASESALGAIIGRTKDETTDKLAHNIWLSILMSNLNVSATQRKESKALIDFDVPLRRKFPVSQPAVYKRLSGYNKPKTYDFKVKPSGFVQTVVVDRQKGDREILPIAPHEDDTRASMRLPWVDFKTGDPIRIDWFGTGHADSVRIMSLRDYINLYQQHAESKAADTFGNRAYEETVGLLHRLVVRSRAVSHIGKEVDRLGEDDAVNLEVDQPIEYDRADIRDDINCLSQFPQVATAMELGISARAWRSIVKGSSNAREATAERIRAVALRKRT